MTKPNSIRLPSDLLARIQGLVTRGHYPSRAAAITGLLTGALDSEVTELPDHLVRRVDGLVEVGRYPSREEALQDLLGRAVGAVESVRAGEHAPWPA